MSEPSQIAKDVLQNIVCFCYGWKKATNGDNYGVIADSAVERIQDGIDDATKQLRSELDAAREEIKWLQSELKNYRRTE